MKRREQNSIQTIAVCGVIVVVCVIGRLFFGYGATTDKDGAAVVSDSVSVATESEQAEESTEQPKQSGATVWVCGGSASACYHKRSDCKGLDLCTTSVKEISLAEAQKNGRKPCGFCNGWKR